MSMEGDNCFSSISSNCPNCVYLYNWSLFRVSGSHPENRIARNGVQIALEGTRALDLFDHDKFRSGPIESRIEKCKLRTINGMNILLRGGIDQQCTHENGFPFQNIPPPPRSRVHATPEEVSKAFGLKTSRSGRLLVPPLAHWCNQTIAHDMDGGIIAILDASSQRDEHSGHLFFTPPKQKDAIQMQKKLCHAANENMSRRKIHKN